MKRRRRKKSSDAKFYMAVSVVCLTVLFVGYGFVYNMSLARKTGKDVTTISIDYDSSGAAEKYGELLSRIMSYFNIFLEETFRENDDGELNSHRGLTDGFYTVLESDDESSAGDMENFDDDDYEVEQALSKSVYSADDRRETFFTVKSAFNLFGGGNAGNMNLNSAAINEKFNVVLYHTHGTESYKPHTEANYRTQDTRYNVMGLGNRIYDNLSNNGVSIKHLTGYNDYPNYNLSYSNSKKAVLPELSDTKKNLLIDLHRDGADENSDYEKFLSQVCRTEVNGKSAATFTLVVGDANDNADKLKDTAQQLYDVAEKMYPGLCREIVVRKGSYFNQNLSDYCMLVEIGSTLNTVDEAAYTADLFSQILGKTMEKLN